MLFVGSFTGTLQPHARTAWAAAGTLALAPAALRRPYDNSDA
jgi:hypothetical protein